MTRRLTLALLSTVLAAAAFAPGAGAATGDYVVYSCHLPDGTGISTSAWTVFGGTRNDTCADGDTGSLLAELPGPTAATGTQIGYRFIVPSGLSLVAYRLSGTFATYSEDGGREWEAGVSETSPPSTLTLKQGCGLGNYGCSKSTLSSTASPVPALAFYAGCNGTDTYYNSCSTGSPDGAIGSLAQSVVTLHDGSAPTLADDPGGSLLAGGAQSGTRTVSGSLSDVGSGVKRTRLTVGGVVVGTQEPSGGCAADQYVSATPCPTTQPVSYSVDTTALSDGAKAVTLDSWDAAGNHTTSSLGDVTIANVAPAADPPAAGSGGGGGGATTIIYVTVPATSGITGAVPTTAVTPSTAPLNDALTQATPRVLLVRLSTTTQRLPGGRVTGRLTDVLGQPASGVALRFDQQALNGGESDWTPIGRPATTDSNGAFTLPASNVSRRIRVSAGDPSAKFEPAVVSYVETLGLSVKASDDELRNHEVLTLTGRLSGAGAAADGKQVVVEARVRGDWQPVGDAMSDEHGHVVWTHRFTHTTTQTRYVFRLRAARTAGLPWRDVTSDTVEVLVNP